MPDRRPILDSSRRKHLRIIERRHAYLEKAIKEPNSESSRTWDMGEMAALAFAIRTIKAHYREPAPEETKS